MADDPKRTDANLENGQNYTDVHSLETDALRLSPRPVSEITYCGDVYPSGQETTPNVDSTFPSRVPSTHRVTSAGYYQSSPVGDSQNLTPESSVETTVTGNSTSHSDPATPMSQIGDSITSRSDSTSPSVYSTSSSETDDSREPIISVPTDNLCTVYTRATRTATDYSIERRDIPIPPKPHPEWRFDDLLVDLNNMITSPKDIVTMKDKFRSTFGKKAIGDIKELRQLFTLMKQRGFLNANEVIYLQSVLLKLGRKDTMQKVIDYSLKNDILHFDFEPSDFDPGGGYETVEFHLRIDDGRYDREKITDLRARVAEILCVDICLVSVANVRPSNSLLVTIMLPKMLVDILAEYLDKDRIQDRFAVLGIDKITIGGREYKIEVSSNPEFNRLDDEVIVYLHQQLSDKDRQLENMRVACNTLEQENTDLKYQLKDKEKKKFRDKEVDPVDVQLVPFINAVPKGNREPEDVQKQEMNLQPSYCSESQIGQQLGRPTRVR